MYNIQKLKNDLKTNVSLFRYNHSLMVAEEAKKLAIHYNLNKEKAYITGLIHDIAKDFNDEENDKWIREYNLTNDLYLKKYKDIIHADIGSIVVKKWYNFDDEICNAILYHTIGNINMSKFDKIIFLADKIARKNMTEFTEKLKMLTYKDLDKALIFYFNKQKEILKEKDLELHHKSLELLDYLNKKNLI